jgi:hypothetical protein
MSATFSVELQQLTWPIHNISVAHLFMPAEDLPASATEPIEIFRLNDGRWFVNDGRHRVIRALLRGETYIVAREKEEHE